MSGRPPASEPSPSRQAGPRDRFPVAVVLERRAVEGNRWIEEQWEAVGVVAGAMAEGLGPEPRVVHADERGERYLSGGFSIRLHRDECASYYANLMGSSPSVFVVCPPAEDGRLRPTLVTLSYDEAAASLETDEQVFAVPIPPELYLALEGYVVEHYAPEVPRKRKRADWKSESRRG